MITEYCQLLSACTRILDGNTFIMLNPVTRRKVKVNLLEGEELDFSYSAAKFIHNPGFKRPEYLLSHANNPLTLWLTRSLDHWNYLKDLALALYDEYKHRYNKPHAAGEVAMRLFPSSKLQPLGFTPPPPSMPDDCKVCEKDLTAAVVKSYRNYYNAHKQHIAKWTNRPVPEWFQINENINH